MTLESTQAKNDKNELIGNVTVDGRSTKIGTFKIEEN